MSTKNSWSRIFFSIYLYFQKISIWPEFFSNIIFSLKSFETRSKMRFQDQERTETENNKERDEQRKFPTQN